VAIDGGCCGRARPIQQYKIYFDKYQMRSPEPAVLSVPADTVVADLE
jgi:hypothetical protein